MKFKVNTVLSIDPNLGIWNDSDLHAKKYYVKNALENHIKDNIDDIIEQIINDNKSKFNVT